MAAIFFIPGFLVGGGIGGGIGGHLVGNGSLDWWTGIGIANAISAIGIGVAGSKMVGRMDAGEGLGKAVALMFLCSIGSIGALVIFIVAANNGFELDGAATDTAVLTAVIPPLACALLLAPFQQEPGALTLCFLFLGPYLMAVALPFGAALLPLACAGGIGMAVVLGTLEVLTACWQKISGAPPESGDGDPPSGGGAKALRARMSETAKNSGARLVRQLSSNRFVTLVKKPERQQRTHELARATSV